MINNGKKAYCPPEVEKVEVISRGLVCLSPELYDIPFSGTGEDW